MVLARQSIARVKDQAVKFQANVAAYQNLSTVGLKRAMWTISVLILVLCLFFAVYFLMHRGVTVIVDNVGKVALEEVWVHVTGESYSLGNIAPGKSPASSKI